MSNIADFENLLSLDQPIQSSVLPRWQRKTELSNNNVMNADRFIPNRSSSELENSVMDNSNNSESMSSSEGPESEESEDYSKMLEEEMLGHGPSRILSYKNKAPLPKDGFQPSLKVLYSQSKKATVTKPIRHISSNPIRILDAPEMLDDYYLNLISWSSNNKLAVALSDTIYIWDAATGSIQELMSLNTNNDTNVTDNYVGAVSFIQEGNILAVGTSSNVVQLWDVEANKQVRTMSGHASRVSCLSWNNHILSSGSRDTTIINHDVRIRDHKIAILRNHTQEVCGLSWSPDGSLLASGANDNTCCIWDCNTSNQNITPKHVLTEHQAAVKALAWSPHEKNLLATGGGTADRHIRFWNANTGIQLNSIDTGSQVCALQWSPFEKEILSSHGYAENQLCLWKYPTLTKMKELKGHTSRVLHLASSPDGSLVCSGAADETLRFWNIFASDSKKSKNDINNNAAINGLSRTTTSSLRIR